LPCSSHPMRWLFCVHADRPQHVFRRNTTARAPHIIKFG
jgi:hypothetical protein